MGASTATIFICDDGTRLIESPDTQRWVMATQREGALLWDITYSDGRCDCVEREWGRCPSLFNMLARWVMED